MRAVCSPCCHFFAKPLLISDSDVNNVYKELILSVNGSTIDCTTVQSIAQQLFLSREYNFGVAPRVANWMSGVVTIDLPLAPPLV